MNSFSLNGALPAGSLQSPCLDLWRNAGYRVTHSDRSYFLTVDDPEVDLILLRPQEIPRYVAEGSLDFGICGYDCILECDAEDQVVELGELVFSKVSRAPLRWVVAVPIDSPIREVADLDGKRIDTEFVFMTQRWLQLQNVQSDLRFSWGTTEVKPGRGFCDAIVEATETGGSLERNRLREVAEVCRSTPRFIASRKAFADSRKREKMEDIALMLRSTLDAEGKEGMMMNVRRQDSERVIAFLPALQKPTMASLSDPDWVSITTIVEETVVREIIPQLKRAGAEGIVTFPIQKLIL